ncbi:MAG: tyrosine-type recombinase/integrase [Verrucomicrobia bacterium]|nr:tyrosine-type recombinase/integrase [Verrucomicrobiota bacterium]
MILLTFMASITTDSKDRSPFYTACFTAFVGQARQQLKKSIATTDRKLAQRIADELEDAAQGKRTTDEIKTFLATNLKTDLRAQRAARKAFDDVLRKTTGSGLGTKTARGYIAEWLARNRGTLAKTSFEKYQGAAKRFYLSLGGKIEQDMAALRVEDVAGFKNDEARRVSKSSANQALKIVRVFFAAAERDGVVPRNVARLVRKEKDSKAEKIKRRAFTLPELNRILSRCNDEWKSLVIFGLYTGARLGDLAAMTWQAVDLEEGKIYFASHKNERAHSIPMSKPLAEHISNLPAGDDPKAPLHPRAFEILARQERVATLSDQFYEIMRDAGLVPARSHAAPKDRKGPGRSGRRATSEISFHALRHTAVSLLKNAGVSDAVARDIAGHESAAVSRLYTHIDDKTKLEALNKLPVIGVDVSEPE